MRYHTSESPIAAPGSSSGLLLSLSSTLERSSPLARSAKRLAYRLNQYARPPRALALAAAELLAQLLDATDDECTDSDLLDASFDD